MIYRPPAGRHGPGLSLIPNRMAWRPYENLIGGKLDNRTPGKITGWLQFYRDGKSPLKVRLDIAGDFHEDIRGEVIRFKIVQMDDASPRPKKTAAGQNADTKRAAAFGAFLSETVDGLAEGDRKRGDDDNVTGVVIE